MSSKSVTRRLCAILAMAAVLAASLLLGAEKKSQNLPIKKGDEKAAVKEKKEGTATAKEENKDAAEPVKKGPEGVVASVNDKPISQEDFKRELAGIKRRFQLGGKSVTEEQLKEIQGDVLDQLIGMRLLHEAGVKKGLVITDDTLKEELATFKKQIPTEEEFKKMTTELGYSEEKLKDDLRMNLLVRKFVKDMEQETKITEDETKEYFEKAQHNFRNPEQVKASHILVKLEADADQKAKDEAMKKIKEIQERLKKGEDFAALAKEFSDCPSKEKGGDIDFFVRGQMDKPFEEAAFALKTGEMSDIVESRFGYHIIKVTEKRPEIKATYEDMKDKIKMILTTLKSRDKVKNLIEELKKDAKIEKYLAAS